MKKEKNYELKFLLTNYSFEFELILYPCDWKDTHQCAIKILNLKAAKVIIRVRSEMGRKKIWESCTEYSKNTKFIKGKYALTLVFEINRWGDLILNPGKHLIIQGSSAALCPNHNLLWIRKTFTFSIEGFYSQFFKNCQIDQ